MADIAAEGSEEFMDLMIMQGVQVCQSARSILVYFLLLTLSNFLVVFILQSLQQAVANSERMKKANQRAHVLGVASLI